MFIKPETLFGCITLIPDINIKAASFVDHFAVNAL